MEKEGRNLMSWSSDPAEGGLPVQLVECLRGGGLPSGFTVTTAPQREAESQDYGACRLALNHQPALFRVARTTPTKAGQFVTLWQRPQPNAEIAPLDVNDGICWVTFAVFAADRRGIFLFDKTILAQKGVFSRGGVGGKRAIRVYAPWVIPTSRQARQTQQWQLHYFHPVP